MNTDYQQLGEELGKLVDTKNAAYGDSFGKSGDFLRLIYPTGIKPHQMHDALVLTRIFDKMMRVATDSDPFGENPFTDIGGYALLGAVQRNERIKHACGSASAVNADEGSKATNGSADQAAPRPITTNAAPSSEPPSSRASSAQPSATSNSTDALTAASEVRANAVALAKERNRLGLCAHRWSNDLSHPLPQTGGMVVVDSTILNEVAFCGQGCRNQFEIGLPV